MKNKNLTNNNTAMNFNDEFDIEKCKILYCLEDSKLLSYTNHTQYSTEDNIKYVKTIKNNLHKLILSESNIIKRQYNKSGCNRIYCEGFGLQYFSNNILQFILPSNSCEYDMKNCSPQILLHLYKKHNLEFTHIKNYCENRDELLKNNNLKKTDINKLTNKDHPKIQNIKWLDDLILEVNNNKPLLFSYENDKINKDYQKIKQKENKNFLSSMCCSIVFYYENEILQKAINKYKCIVPKFDGFLTNQDIDIEELNEISKEYDVKWDKKYFDNIITETTYDNEILNNLLYTNLIYPHSFNTTLDLAETIQHEIKKELIFCNNKWYIYHKKLWITIKNPNYTISKFINNELNKTLEEKLKESDIDIDEVKKTFNKVKQTLDKSAFMNGLIKNLELLLLDD